MVYSFIAIHFVFHIPLEMLKMIWSTIYISGGFKHNIIKKLAAVMGVPAKHFEIHVLF